MNKDKNQIAFKPLTVWAMTVEDKVILQTICDTKKEAMAENYNLFGPLGLDYVPRKFKMTEIK